MDCNVCRICLSKTATISIFDKQDDIQYSTKIMRCVNVVITEGDGLPDYICTTCIDDLTVSYNFVEKCETADKTLRYVSLNNDLCSDGRPKIELEIKQEIKDEPYQASCQDDFLLDDTFKEEFTIKHRKRCEFRNEKRVKGKYGRKKFKRNRSGPIQCVICGLMTSSPSAMEIHMRTHTGEKPFSCQFCDSHFPTKGALKRHTETFHTHRERKFICETCGNSFYRKTEIITHMRIHTNEKPYACSYCPKTFSQVSSMIRHKRTHTGDKPFSCHICGRKFADRSLVKKHQSVHSDEKKFSCHLCSKSMKSKTALNVHMSLHTNEKQNICSYCGMAFSVKGNLKTHIRRAHSEKSGQCSVCLKTFSDLEAHMRKHTGERPFVCDICNQAFTTKRSLAYHIVFKHENSAKFKCSIGECTRTFPTAMMLEFHLLKQHTNHTPYICQHCSRGFFRTSDLSRHLRVSHMDIQMKMPLKSGIS